jgi:predicted PurR-regulated permease PerM
MLVALPVEISTSLFEAFLVAFIALYALLLAPQAHETLLSLFPIPQRDRVTAITQETLHVMGGYFRGASITGAIIGSLTYVGLLIIGVNFALVAALVAALAEFIPFVGPLISGAFVVTISFLQSPSKALIALIFTIALQQVESNLVAPNVMHPQTCISPLATLVAIFAGGTVGGVLGALVAIPLYAAFRVITARLILPAIRRQTGAPPRENEEVC